MKHSKPSRPQTSNGFLISRTATFEKTDRGNPNTTYEVNLGILNLTPARSTTAFNHLKQSEEAESLSRPYSSTFLDKPVNVFGTKTRFTPTSESGFNQRPQSVLVAKLAKLNDAEALDINGGSEPDLVHFDDDRSPKRRNINTTSNGRKSFYVPQKKDLSSVRTSINKTSMEDLLYGKNSLQQKNYFGANRKQVVKGTPVAAAATRPMTSKAQMNAGIPKKEKPDPFAAFLARHPEIVIGDTPTASSKNLRLSKSIQVGTPISNKKRQQMQQSHMRLGSAASASSHLVRSSSDLNSQLEKKRAFQQFRHERFSIMMKRRELNKTNKELLKMEQDELNLRKAVQTLWLSQIFLVSHLKYIRVAFIFQKKLNEKKQKNMEFRLSVDSHVRQYLEAHRKERAQQDLLASAR